jgi:hypothetical protein
MALSVTSGGVFLITDGISQRVHVYSRDGRLLRTIGRKGRGPGEFQMIGAAVLLNDSILAILDDSRRTVTMFRFHDGAYLYEVPFEGTGASLSSVHGDTLTFGVLHVARGTGLAELVLGDTAVRHYAQAPQARLEVPALSGIHTPIAHARTNRGVVVGFSGVDSLFEFSPGGDALATVPLPPLRRRHLSRNAAETFGRPTAFPELFAATSFLFEVFRLEEGGIAVLHMDQDIQDRAITSRPFLTLLSSSLVTECLDVPIPVASEARLVPAFHGDTVVFVTQRIEGGTVRASIEGFAVEPSRCDRAQPQ